MSVRVEFSNETNATPSKGSAGLGTQIGGACTTVSVLMEAGKKEGESGFIKPSIV